MSFERLAYKNLVGRDYDDDSLTTIEFNVSDYKLITDMFQNLGDSNFADKYRLSENFLSPHKTFFIGLSKIYIPLQYEFFYDLYALDEFEFWFSIIRYFETQIYKDIRIATRRILTIDVDKLVSYIFKNINLNDNIEYFFKYQDSDNVFKLYSDKLNNIRGDLILIINEEKEDNNEEKE